jgi:hypothetical protein
MNTHRTGLLPSAASATAARHLEASIMMGDTKIADKSTPVLLHEVKRGAVPRGVGGHVHRVAGGPRAEAPRQRRRVREDSSAMVRPGRWASVRVRASALVTMYARAAGSGWLAAPPPAGTALHRRDA